jgi:predicted restriction endonuclease
VLYIAGLKQVPRPPGIAKDSAPQGPHYLEEAILRGSLADELEQARAEKEAEGASSPADLDDARKRIVAAIVLRQGRATFRAELLAAYQYTCAVTGCDVIEALEAAHIVPYLGPETDDVRNGLLLRGDIHTLFDLSLVAVNPSDYRLLVSNRLKGRFYQALAGQLIQLPVNEADHPSREALEIRLAEFRRKQES